MEFFLGLVLAWPFWIAVCCGSILFTHLGWHFWGIVFTVILGILTWQMLSLSWIAITTILILYIPVGFVWSFFRWKKHCNVTVKEYKSSICTDRYDYTRKLDVKQNIDAIVGWVILWPFSLIDSFLGDLIDMVTSMIKTLFRKTYTTIANNSLAQIEEIKSAQETEKS